MASNVLHIKPADWEFVLNAEPTDDGHVVRSGWTGAAWAEAWMGSEIPVAVQPYHDGLRNCLAVLCRYAGDYLSLFEFDLDAQEIIHHTALANPPEWMTWKPGDVWDSAEYMNRAYFTRQGMTLVCGRTVATDSAVQTEALFGSRTGRVEFNQGVAATSVSYHEGSFGGKTVAKHIRRLWFAGFRDNQILFLHSAIPYSLWNIPEARILDASRQQVQLDSQTIIATDPGNLTSIRSDSYIHIDDGPITALYSFRDKMAVFTPYSMWVVEGLTQEEFTYRRVDLGPGCVAPKSICETKRGLTWLGPDNVYVWDGGASVKGILPDRMRRWVFEGKVPTVLPKRARMNASGPPGDDPASHLGYPWILSRDHAHVSGGTVLGRGQMWLNFPDAHCNWARTATKPDAAASATGPCISLVWNWESNLWHVCGPGYSRTSDYARHCDSVAQLSYLVQGTDGKVYGVGPNTLAVLDDAAATDSRMTDYSGDSVFSVLLVSKVFGAQVVEKEWWRDLHVWMESQFGSGASARAYVIPERASMDTDSDIAETDEVEFELEVVPRPTANYVLDQPGDAWATTLYGVQRDDHHQEHNLSKISQDVRVAILLTSDLARANVPRVSLTYTVTQEDGREWA